MFHLKDFRRRNVSSSPYLSPRVLEASSTTNNHDPINEHDIPAHGHVLIHIPNNDNAHNTSQADSEVEDVFAPGDIVGKGSLLKGDVVSLLPTDRDKLSDEDEDEQFQVIKELGKGSYAIVYLVHQVFFTPCRGVSVPGVAASRDRSDPESNEDCQILGHMDSDVKSHQPQKTYGRKFAIKCLSKANLDREELDIQLAEVGLP
jgi:predicted  nucleic acid-binding Zn-ribbon protein